MSGAPRPSWLIFGGTGVYGRSLVKYLIDNNLASFIRVADKRLPFMSFLSHTHKDAFAAPNVECIQVDVSDEEHVARAFTPSHTTADTPWDYVVNFAAETAHGKSDEFYEKCVLGAGRIAQEVQARGVKKLIFASTASVYAPSAAPKGEGAKLGPWNKQAAFMLKAEEAVKAVPGCPWVIIRPAVTYGPGDVAGVMPRCVIASAYVRMGEKMQFMWDGELKCNTVHVFDVARAVYFLARKAEAGTVWNLADKGDTDQAKLAAAMSAVFGIETGFVGSMKSTMASAMMDTVVDAANEKHLAPWLALLAAHKIKNTPLSPFLHRELLGHNHLCIDGSAIESLGFKYAVPELSADAVRESVALHIAQGIFPPVLPGSGAAGGAAAAAK